MQGLNNVGFILSSLWGFVLALVGGLGGGAVVVAIIVKFTSEKIADRLQAKYQLKLDKEIEVCKTELEKVIEDYRTELSTKQHISVKRFDAEFEIYQKLTKTFFDAVRDCGIMIPVGLTYVPADEAEQKKADAEHYNSALKSAIMAQDYLNSIVPFIREDLYEGYKEILRLMRLQINAYESRCSKLNSLRYKEKKDYFDMEDYKRTEDIYRKFEDLNGKVREYLNGLDVIGTWPEL